MNISKPTLVWVDQQDQSRVWWIGIIVPNSQLDETMPAPEPDKVVMGYLETPLAL
jgi:hypothetical protein